nr:MAG TPA: hypothetical protein [Caudoviricetes sp.]
MNRRRFMGRIEKKPVLIKLTDNPGSDLSYTFLSGYKYVDMLIVGGGGAGGKNSAGGGASGTLLYVKNFILGNLQDKIITYNLAGMSSSNGHATKITIGGVTITVSGGSQGGSNGFNGSYGGNGGSGGNLNETAIISVLTKYVSNAVTDIAIANNGGGSGGYWYNPESYGYAAGSGATMSNSGKDGSGTTAGAQVSNGDGTGGNRGGNNGKIGNSFGAGYRRNAIVIPVVSVFKGGGTGGKASNGLGASGAGIGGGAAGYMSGGDCAFTNSSSGYNGSYGGGGGGGGSIGGLGGQGIICFYYHN